MPSVLAFWGRYYSVQFTTACSNLLVRKINNDIICYDVIIPVLGLVPL